MGDQSAQLDGSISLTSLKQAGDSAFGRSDYEDAAEAYGRALASARKKHGAADPQLLGALHANRCLALLKLGAQQSDRALEDAREACCLRPRWGKGALRLGQALEACGRAGEAAAAYSRAAELNPSLEPAVGKALAALEKLASRQRCLAVLQGHRGPIYDLAVHPLSSFCLGLLTTRLIATAGADATVRLWCSVTGRQLQHLTDHSDMVTCLAWSPCGSLLASAALDGTVRLWRLAARDPAVATPDRLSGAGSGSGGDGVLPRASAGAPQLPLLEPWAVLSGHGGRVTCLEFSPDSALLATGSSEGQVWIKGTAGSSCAKATDGESTGYDSCLKLDGHGSLVAAVAFSPCGQLLASASGDGTCKVWSSVDGKCVADIAWESGPVNCCRFVQLARAQPLAAAAAAASSQRPAGPRHAWAGRQGPPASLLLTCHVQQQRREGRVLLWDVVERRHGWVDNKLEGPLAALDGFQGKVTSVDICLPCSCSTTGNSTTTTSSSSHAAGGPAGADSAAAAAAAAAAVAAAGGEAEGEALPAALLATACNDGSVKLFDLAAIAEAGATDLGSCSKKAAAAPLLELALPDTPFGGTSSGGPASWQGSLPAWTTVSMQAASHERNIVALSPSGGQLAAAGPDRRVRVVCVEGSSERQVVLAGHGGALRALCWLGPGRLVSAGEDGVARVWDASEH